jgi:hypothetical protein
VTAYPAAAAGMTAGRAAAQNDKLTGRSMAEGGTLAISAQDAAVAWAQRAGQAGYGPALRFFVHAYITAYEIWEGWAT